MNQILHSVSQPWLLTEPAYNALLARASAIITSGSSPQPDEDKPEHEKNFAVLASANTVRYSLDDPNIPEGSIAVISFRDIITKYSSWWYGTRGTLMTYNDLIIAEANPKIKAYVFVFDTPGGEVSFTNNLAYLIASLKKPAVSFVEGMCCSAGYWLAAGTSKIIASSELDEIGCVGTQFSWVDWTPYYEKLGIKIHQFVSDDTPDKNAWVDQIRKGKYDEYKKQVLNPITDSFLGHINANRKVKPEALTGKVYFGTEAKDLGLIDEINTLEYAITEADTISTPERTQDTEEATNEVTNQQNTANMKMKILAAWAAIISFFAFKADEEVEITNEHMERLNAEMTSRQGRIDQLTSELEAANTKATGLEQQAQKDAQTIAGLQDQVAALTNAPGADSAEVTSKTEIPIPGDDETEINSFNELSAAEAVGKLKEMGYSN